MYLADRIHLRRPDDYPVADQHVSSTSRRLREQQIIMFSPSSRSYGAST